MHQVVFESLNQSCCDAAYLLHQQCHPNPWSREAFIDCLSRPYFGSHMKFDDLIIGYFIGLNVVGEVTLMDIGVGKDYQGQGLGKSLLNQFLAKSRSLGGEEIWLEVRQSNTTAISLYESFRFDLIETRKNYYTVPSEFINKTNAKEDALIMKKTLLTEHKI